jgi:FtsP/CotA-like multicopper oxidase with cupredoxin domain
MKSAWIRRLSLLAMAGTLASACTTAAPAPTGSTGPAHASHGDIVVADKYGLQPLTPTMSGDVKEFTLTAKAIKWEVIPGETVDAYAYNEQVPGPLLRVKEGEKLRIILKNELPEPTVIHFHGPTIPNNMDGVPDVTQPLVMPGESFTYEFTAKPVGTFVYHTHHNSAIQEAKGLYGVLIIDPADEVKPPYDVEALQVLSELGGYYVINGKSFPTTQTINANVGDKVRIRLVNMGQFVSLWV